MKDEYSFEMVKKEEREEGKLEGILEGILEGKVKGILEGKLETAKKMLDEGLSIEMIIKVTGLSNHELISLK